MKPLRIAIAEDNWLVAEYLCGELAALGHAIVGRARTGEDLITLVAHERPDLVLADIRLAHGSDGLAAAREVQERYDIPAIAGHRKPRRHRGGSGGTAGDPEQAVHHGGLASGPRGGGSMAGERLEQALPETLRLSGTHSDWRV
jgi:hypothetical protein